MDLEQVMEVVRDFVFIFKKAPEDLLNDNPRSRQDGGPGDARVLSPREQKQGIACVS